MTAVLITILNGAKVLDSGSGVVLRQHKGKTYVLTCAHNLRALSSTVSPTTTSPVRVLVNGKEAKDTADAELARRDLAVLTVDGYIGPEAMLKTPGKVTGEVKCRGFARFFQDQFAIRIVEGKVQATVDTVMPDGTATEYLQIKPGANSASFEKGLSGAPVYQADLLVGIARILAPSEHAGDGNKAKKPMGYAIRLSPAVTQLVQEKLPELLNSAANNPDRPPEPPQPKPQSLENDDLQKNRWGGKSEAFGRRLLIENVRQFARYFMFDAVVVSTDGSPLVGPFVYHLHNTFAKPVIWIRRTDGVRAALEQIEASGTFTIGVQLKDKTGVWRSLEKDLAKYDGGRLKRYD